MPKLSNEQIKQRLIEGRNYKHLYLELKGNFDEVKAENKSLRAENQELKEAVATLKIQVAELQTMVFGKKQKPPTGHPGLVVSLPPPPPRTKESYRRPLPPAHAITSERPVPLPEACSCGGTFKDITTHERFEEDIPLPDLTENYQACLATKYTVERGICTSCARVRRFGMGRGSRVIK